MRMKVLVTASALAVLVGTAAIAQERSTNLLTAVPENATTVTSYYKQSVYDPSDSKIGEVMDLLVQSDGKIAAAMVGVGGFLGIGEKDVAVSFDSLRLTTKNNKTFLVMSTTKDALKAAPGFKYDRSTTHWVQDRSASTN